ncbi:MAG: DUF2971 domain-containing protein, partial [Acholeplasma sp.]|nr:DUF2971 domain-containing protein [Acholeplasma sp.]
FMANKTDKNKLAYDIKIMQEKIGEENIAKIKIDPLNIRIDDFKEMSKFAGIAPGFQEAEVRVNDSVDSLNKKIFSFIDDRFGIASLTTRYDDALMWSHYASSHTGICVEYDFKDYIEQLDKASMMLFPVNYSEKRVTIDQSILDKIDLKNIEKQGRKDILKLFIEGLYTKNVVWKYENEWRSIVLINNDDINSRKISTIDISALYLGSNMDKETKKALIKLLDKDDELSKIHVFEMRSDISEYKTSVSRIR